VSSLNSNIELNEQEEDFTSQLYHRELLPRVTAAEVQSLLDEGLSYIATASISPVLKGAIKTRLLFRRSFLKALEHDTGPLSARTKSSLLCTPLLEGIKDTAHLGTAVNDCFSTKVQRSLASSVPPRPMVTVKLSDALSHFTNLCHDAADVDQILEIETTEDLYTAVWVFMSRMPQPSVYIRALVQSFLSDQETGQVLGKMSSKEFLVSSLAAVVLPSSLLLNSANEMVEAPTDPRFQMARILTEFDGKVCQRYLNIFRNACLNRCRTRRTICHMVLDWDSLQADTEDLDGALRTFTEEQPASFASGQPTFSYPLSSWVYHHKLNHLRAIIQLGFELTIYAPDEFAGVYWYLSYACGTHLSHIDRISFFLQRDMQTQDALSQESRLVGELNSNHRVPFQKTLKNLFRIYTHLKATEALSRALHALHALLLRLQAFKIPPRPYSSNSLRYELRMRPFLSLNVPEPVDFETFQDESSFAGVEDEQVLEEAASRVAEARSFWDEVLEAGWSAQLGDTAEEERPSKRATPEAQKRATTIEGEWSKGVKNVIRACIAASICVATLKKRLNTSGDLKGVQATVPIPGGKDCWHDWWIVPRISEVSS
jgi:N-alpha-acetyltransferase 35, NatC auxiliary subunit